MYANRAATACWHSGCYRFQEKLGEIVYVQLPDEGADVTEGGKELILPKSLWIVCIKTTRFNILFCISFEADVKTN